MEPPALRRSQRPLLPLLLPMALALGWAAAAAQAATTAAPSPLLPPSPAPAPAPEYVNITQVLVYAGDYSTFLNLLTSSGVLEKFQKQANDTDVGITIFAPKSKAFTTQPAATLLKNVSGQELQSLLEYSALGSYHSLTDLQQASGDEPAAFTSFNGGGSGYELNVTTIAGQVQIVTDWNRATIVTTLYDSQPCSIFALDQVLLPEALFGLPAPSPAPSPSPLSSTTPTATPSSPSSSGSSSAASGPSSSHKSFASPPFTPRPLYSLLVLLPLLIFKLL